MAANDVWQLTVRGTLNETQHIHTLHFLEMVGQPDGAALLTSWQGGPMTAYRNLFYTDGLPVGNIQARKVCGSTPLPSPDEVTPVPASQTGTRALVGEHAPGFIAALVTEKGVISGRRYSGRFFIGGMREQDFHLNTIAGAYVTLLTAYCAALTTAYISATTADFRLFCFSSLLANGDPNRQIKNPDGPGTITSPVAAVGACQDAGSLTRLLVVSPYVTTMRSRKLGHGN